MGLRIIAQVCPTVAGVFPGSFGITFRGSDISCSGRHSNHHRLAKQTVKFSNAGLIEWTVGSNGNGLFNFFQAGNNVLAIGDGTVNLDITLGLRRLVLIPSATNISLNIPSGTDPTSPPMVTPGIMGLI